MGGAFIGVADDATAASWNPAGLIQLETPEVSIVGAYNYRREDTTYNAFPEASGPQTVSTFDLNYFSAAYPFTILQKNMIVSLNYQQLFDFNRKVDYSFTFTDSGPPSLVLNNNVDYDQDGSLNTISPAFAIQILPQLSLGFTINIWNKEFCYWKSTYDSTGNGRLGSTDFIEQTRIKERYEFEGLNFNIGFLWNINSTFSLGGVFKTPFTADLDHKFRFTTDREVPTAPGSDTHISQKREDKQTLDMPMSYGLGLGVRLSDALTFDLDVSRTEWDDFIRHADGQDFNAVTGKPSNISKSKATTQVRLGGEYLIIGNKVVIPIRAGVFYDPEPSENNPDDFFGFSAGSGIAYKKFVYDVAYQYRFGRDIRTVTVGNENSSQDVDQHTVYMSAIYHF
jgi:long-subunit fatty acid transport protein